MQFLCIVIGYLCGCLLTADVVARYKTGKSAFKIGTGNPGMANILEQLGAKWAAITLLGDVFKTVLPCLLCRYLLFKSLGPSAILYAGLGTALGHGFPFWHKFRGGRSVAVICMYIVLLSPLWGLIANLTGLCIVIATGYLALGALAIPTLFLIPVFLNFGLEAGFVALAGVALVFFLHRDSIRRIANKVEKKVDLLAKFSSENSALR
ncbi:glycerol-3-phosphate acyltransferase [Caproiciproducens sp. CPB-2]|uniref:glycerol-3-phosphate acyltransferase n=1 Tax=Caproiciproducens sp. CPB-2 TaxID=3030017 RepID=UPI0023D9AD1B|nr:glycerol-3-phosphate acyltransferase [Caproiciproducens sp. CPB-2]MDF1494076.1 glycerol-3-phosphate acyltransferase [Caproiciproducens sp. CPB-2]